MLKRSTVGAGSVDTPIGALPRAEDLNMNGLSVSAASLTALLNVDAPLWRKEMSEIAAYFARYGERLPDELMQELALTRKRLG
jgi:phosphoenolpyruvate carboxykinase (GTP)